jgi:hypothetical protein
MKTPAVSKFGITRHFTEAVDLPSRSAKVLIITEGLGNLKDKNFYTSDAVRSAVKVFNGKRFFIDHPSRSEEEDRPERSVRDLAGYFYECQLGQVKDPDTGESLAACYAKLKFAESEPGNLAMRQVLAALEYQTRFPQSKDVYCGISINGGGISHPGSVKGVEVNMVTEIQEAFSADIVTMPARGGKFLAMIQEADRRIRTNNVRESLRDVYAAWDRDVEAALRIFRREARRVVREAGRRRDRLGRTVEAVVRMFGKGQEPTPRKGAIR